MRRCELKLSNDPFVNRDVAVANTSSAFRREVDKQLAFGANDIPDFSISNCGNYTIANCGNYTIANCGNYTIANCG
jgi:hypothetical protein